MDLRCFLARLFGETGRSRFQAERDDAGEFGVDPADIAQQNALGGDPNRPGWVVNRRRYRI
jgi:hypothetical protein